MAASATSGGPSVSGKPWPRLIDPVRAASADISAKIVVAKGWRTRRMARRLPAFILATRPSKRNAEAQNFSSWPRTAPSGWASLWTLT